MNRLNKMRIQNKLTFKELSEKLKEKGIKISPDSLAKYERGDREPKIDKWQALANFFDVSVPYLQGIDDKPNTGYSKEYIYKCLDDAYKEKWKDPTGQIMGGGFDKTVDAYLKQAKIKKPSNMNKEFWQDNFNFLFDTPNIKRLLTTKDKYSDNDIKLVLEYTIFLNFTGMKQIIDYYNNK
ncbi:helix-turn-helix domain-containing protein [Lactobacillus crispatus]|uniref:helix-turn-helix domain-containing protein n=1 Tax=Lactobacillus crispatus TaxID=47770 RepID=UPI001238674B|nr:helix-turn-helix transcriptional regulator [Lactobacillus crispatus]KAA8809247.1 helix-turn-helix transcriptional regulator [Lactobacillus crispatus]